MKSHLASISLLLVALRVQAAEVSLIPPVLLPDGQEFKSWVAGVEFSRTYHVDQRHPRASDQNPGTAELPFRTIGRAAGLLQPGERVMVAAGVYREHVAPARGGSGPDRMISYEAAPGAEVIIRGSEHVPGGWTPATGWRGLDATGAGKIWRLALKPEWFAGYNPFALVNLPRLAAQDCFTPKANLLTTLLAKRGLVFQDDRPLRQVKQPSELATAEGTYWVEWNGQALYVRLRGDVAPAAADVEVTTREQAFAPRDYELGYIRVKGFTIEQVADGFPWPQRAALSTMRGHHWLIEENTIRWANALGMDIGRSEVDMDAPVIAGHHIVRRNRVSDCGVCGIAGTGPLRATLIEDNVVARCGWQNVEEYYECAGIKTHHNHNTLIRRNLLTDMTHAAGIWMDYGNINSRCSQNVVLNTDSIFETLWYPSSHIVSAPDFWDNDYFDDTYWHNGQRRAFTGYTTEVFFREAMRWMREQALSDKRFLCYLPTAAPHGPHFVPASQREAMAALVAKAELPKLKPAEREQLTRYLAMIANIDENMGRLDAFLRETGLRDNTIVVFLTDNGSTFGPRYFNAGMKGGKVTLWEGGHRVPCFIQWPAGGLRPAGDVTGLTEVQDLLPTLLDLAGAKTPPTAKFDGISLAGVLRGTSEPPADRAFVVQFSRMDHPQPEQGDACVLWRQWRLVQDKELYDRATDPAQERNVIAGHPDIAARLRQHYAKWWDGVAPGLSDPQRVIIGHDAEPVSLLSPCEWRDVFFDQGAQVRRGERKNGVWHLEVARAGKYEFELRRWPREREVPLREGVPAQPNADGEFPAGTRLPIAKARLKIAVVDRTVDVAAAEASARFRVSLHAGPDQLQTWFIDDTGGETGGAYYVYARRLQTTPPVKLILDTDMSGDADDAGTLALLHALADRGECELLATVVNRADLTKASAAAVDAINTWYGRPNIPIGTAKQGPTALQRTSRYTVALRDGFPNDIGPDDRAPDALDIYRRVLMAQPDGSVTICSVGALSNLATVWRCAPELVRAKVRRLVVMGGEFPASKKPETNIATHREAAQVVAAEWPAEIVWHGFEVGNVLFTGARLKQTPQDNPVRRSFELRQYRGRPSIEGGQPSYDQAAALFAVRGGEPEFWETVAGGRGQVDAEGLTTWQPDTAAKHAYVKIAGSPERLAALIEALMVAPRVSSQTGESR